MALLHVPVLVRMRRLTAPRKQRHTAPQIYRCLVAEKGYTGKYDQVRRYLQKKRVDRRETFIPLEHRPVTRAEAAFGHIHVDFPDGRRQVPVLIVTWSYSNAPFAIALPSERTEAILHGLVEAFAFSGCVPAELWWDNPKTVAIHLFQGRQRTLHPRYAALASHYPFTPKFCLPAAATEDTWIASRSWPTTRSLPRTCAVTVAAKKCSIHGIFWWFYNANLPHSTWLRSTATGNFRLPSPTSAATWKPASDLAAALVSTSVCCNCW